MDLFKARDDLLCRRPLLVLLRPAALYERAHGAGERVGDGGAHLFVENRFGDPEKRGDEEGKKERDIPLCPSHQ